LDSYLGDSRKWKRRWNDIREMKICLKWKKSGDRMEMIYVKKNI
jgi:hypothetical protein